MYGLLISVGICLVGVMVAFFITQDFEEAAVELSKENEVVTVINNVVRDETPIQILQRRLASGDIDLETFHRLVQRC